MTTTTHPFENTPAGRVDHTATVGSIGLFKSAVADSAYRYDHPAGAIYYLARTWTFTLDMAWAEWRDVCDAGLCTFAKERLMGAFDMGVAEWKVKLDGGHDGVAVVVHRRIDFVSRAKLPRGAEKVSAAIDNATALGPLKVRSPADIVRVLASVIAAAVEEAREVVGAERDAATVKRLRRQLDIGLRNEALKSTDYDRRLRQLNEELQRAIDAREVEFRSEVLRTYLGDGDAPAQKTLPDGVRPELLRRACDAPLEAKGYGAVRPEGPGVLFFDAGE